MSSQTMAQRCIRSTSNCTVLSPHARHKKRCRRCRSVFRIGRSAPRVTTLTRAQTAAAILHFLGQVSVNRSRTLSVAARPYNNRGSLQIGCRLRGEAKTSLKNIRQERFDFLGYCVLQRRMERSSG